MRHAFSFEECSGKRLHILVDAEVNLILDRDDVAALHAFLGRWLSRTSDQATSKSE